MSDEKTTTTVTTDAAPADAIAPTKQGVEPALGGAVAPEQKAEETKPTTDVTKSEETKPAEKAETKPEKADAGEPIKYDFKIPEGVKFDEKQLAAFGDLGNKLKIAPEAAQELLDFHTSEVKRIVAEAADQGRKAFETTINGWKAELEADPAFSGDNRTKVQERLGKLLDEYGSPEVRQAFDATGTGWNPHIVKFMDKIAQALTEGRPTTQGNPPGERRGAKSPGQTLYGQPKGN